MPGNLAASVSDLRDTFERADTDPSLPEYLTTSRRFGLRFEVFWSRDWWTAENLARDFAETIGPLSRAALQESAAIVHDLLFEKTERGAVGPITA